MGWNQPNNTSRDGHGSHEATGVSLPRSRRFRGALAALIVVAGAVIAAYFLFPSGDRPQKALVKQGTKAISEVTPAVAKKSAEKDTPQQPKKKRVSGMSREEKIAYYKERFGDNMPAGLKQELYFLENPPQKRFKQKSPTPYLRHSCERMIAGIVLQEPGTYFVIQPEFNESFNDEFMTALIDPIEINADDPEDVRDVKKAVTDVKKEIADLCKKEGLKPNEVLNAQAKAMYELGQYQRNLEEELDRIHENPELSDRDVEDFCVAANKLLQEKGLAPIPLPDLTRRSIRLKHAQRRAELKAARQAQQQPNKEMK